MMKPYLEQLNKGNPQQFRLIEKGNNLESTVSLGTKKKKYHTSTKFAKNFNKCSENVRAFSVNSSASNEFQFHDFCREKSKSPTSEFHDENESKCLI